MNKYRFHLEKYHTGSKTTCPKCERKACFTRYVDEENEISFPSHVGKCDHENSCGYHFTPKDYFKDNPQVTVSEFSAKPREQCVMQDVPPSFIDTEIVQQSQKLYESNPLYTFLVRTIGKENTSKLFTLYKVGTSKKWNFATVFWQIDTLGKVRSGKIMLYDANTGRRVKEPHAHVCWVHSELKKQGFKLQQCFFGEHLLSRYPDKRVFVVESEKTAIIAANFIPDGLWIATGGKNGCFNAQAVKVLASRDVILMPDLGVTSEWQEKVSMLRPICRSVSVSSVLEDVATDEQRKQGLDIADFLLMKDTPQMILQRMIDKNPVLQKLIDELDLVLVDES